MERISLEKQAISAVLVALSAVACGATTPQPTSAPAAGKTDEMGKPASAGPTAEQRRAVQAFAGEWLLHWTITLPDGKPIKADLAMSCSETAGGRANACTLSGDVPGMPPLDAGILVGVDRLDDKVHFMAMTSDDELHDHVCSWQDDKNLVCNPLKAGIGGQPITEELAFSFDADQMSLKSAIHFADGTKMLFEGPGSRISAPPARARATAKPADASAEQKKLVDTFLGNWKLDGEIAFPNGSRGRAALDLKCRATAGGKASLCTLGAKDIAGRPYEAAILVGHDPFDKNVHLMMMSSDDEVWHRACAWKGDSVLACGSMRTGVLGMPVTTEVSFDFSGAPASTRWLTDLGDGKTCLLTAQMSR
jgi:hypothetical protein